MQPAICCLPCSPLRADSSHKSEMVSQLLFGECCMILDQEQSDWVKIKCKYDGYEGWCQSSHVVEIGQSLYETEEKKLTRGWITELQYNGYSMKVPFGSLLPGLKKGHTNWGKNKLVYSGKTWNPAAKASKNKKRIRQLAYTWINTPYLWGGKTVFGTDCSGYTQTIFRFLDIPLFRDAWQQATQGELIGSLKKSSLGDLAFFDNAEGKITHVGILLDKHEIIHASGKVRVDKINSEGIINLDTGKQTHHLKLIRRYLRK